MPTRFDDIEGATSRGRTLAGKSLTGIGELLAPSSPERLAQAERRELARQLAPDERAIAKSYLREIAYLLGRGKSVPGPSDEELEHSLSQMTRGSLTLLENQYRNLVGGRSRIEGEGDETLEALKGAHAAIIKRYPTDAFGRLLSPISDEDNRTLLNLEKRIQVMGGIRAIEPQGAVSAGAAAVQPPPPPRAGGQPPPLEQGKFFRNLGTRRDKFGLAARAGQLGGEIVFRGSRPSGTVSPASAATPPPSVPPSPRTPPVRAPQADPTERTQDDLTRVILELLEQSPDYQSLDEAGKEEARKASGIP